MMVVFLLWMFSFCEAHAFDHEKEGASGPVKAINTVQSYTDLSQVPADKIDAYQAFVSRLSVSQNLRVQGLEGKMSCLYFLEHPLAGGEDGPLRPVVFGKMQDLQNALLYGQKFYKSKSDQFIKDKILKPFATIIMWHKEIENCIQKICFPAFSQSHPPHLGYEESTKKENLHKQFWDFQPLFQLFAQKVIDILTWRGEMRPGQTQGVFFEDDPNPSGVVYRYLFFKENNSLDVFCILPHLPIFSCAFLPDSSIEDTDKIREMYFQYGRRVEDKALIVGRNENGIFCEPYLGCSSKRLEDGRVLPPFSRRDATHRKVLESFAGSSACDILDKSDPILPILKDALDESEAVYYKWLTMLAKKTELPEFGSAIVLPVELAPQHETLYTLLFLEYLMEEAGEEVETQKRDVQGAIQGRISPPGTKIKGKGGRKKASNSVKHEEQSGPTASGASDAKEGATQKDEHGLNPSPALSSKAAWLEAKAMQRRVEEASQAKIDELHRSLAQELKEQVQKDYAHRIAKEQQERQEEVANQPLTSSAQKSGKQTKRGRTFQGSSHKKTTSSPGKDLEKHQEAIIDRIVAEEKESGRIKYRVAHKILGKLMMRGGQDAGVSTKTRGSHTVIHAEGGRSVTVPKKHGQKDATIPTTRLKKWMRGVLSSVGSSLNHRRSEGTPQENAIGRS